MNKILTIPEVARLAGWTRERMWRHLSAVNAQLGGMLLKNTSRGSLRPRWTISLQALQAISPQWFQDPETLNRQIVELRKDVEELKIVQQMHTDRFAELAKAS